MLKVKSKLYVNGQLIKTNFFISNLGVVWFGAVLCCLVFFFFSVRNLNLAKKILAYFTSKPMLHFSRSYLSIYELAFKNGSLRHLNTRAQLLHSAR